MVDEIASIVTNLVLLLLKRLYDAYKFAFVAVFVELERNATQTSPKTLSYVIIHRTCGVFVCLMAWNQ